MQITRRVRESRRRQATAEFDDASLDASANGLILQRHDAAHYTLRPCSKEPEWILNIWPGPRRLHVDPNSRAPIQAPEMDGEWTLGEVVRACFNQWQNGAEK